MESSASENSYVAEQREKGLFACLENPDTLTPESRQEIEQIKRDGINIDWGATQDELEVEKMKHGGELTYAISPVDKRDKYSEHYVNCLGVIATGRNSDGENISMMAHLNADLIFPSTLEEKFSHDLMERLKTLEAQSIPGSIEVVFLGGEYPTVPTKDDHPPSLAEYWRRYEEAIRQLHSLVSLALKIEPAIATGPKAELLQETNAYFSNDKRRLYIVQEDYTQGHSGRASEVTRLYKKN